MSWIRLPIEFPRNLAIFVFPVTPVADFADSVLSEIGRALQCPNGDRGKTVRVACELVIRRYRPDLIGAMPIWYDFDFGRHCHKVAVSHPSLPECLVGMPMVEIVIGSAKPDAAVQTEETR